MSLEQSKKCPFCGKIFHLTDNHTYKEKGITFFPGCEEPAPTQKREKRSLLEHLAKTIDKPHETVWVKMYYCPQCQKTSLELSTVGGGINGMAKYTYPECKGEKFPDYVPFVIRNDYEEACSIVSLSPKASATLSRRCLQGIIRDFWGINTEFWNKNPDIKTKCKCRNPKMVNLHSEIKAVELSRGIDATLVAAFIQLKEIANIGAHTENDVSLIVDIEPGEAETLLTLIELIIRKTYIQRNDDEALLKRVNTIERKEICPTR